MDRLERGGKFPVRVKLGEGFAGWVEEEIEDHLVAKAAERNIEKGDADQDCLSSLSGDDDEGKEDGDDDDDP